MKDPEVVVFGGTFDPPHQGHVDLLLLTKALFRTSKIIIVPSYKPPVSGQETKKVTLDFDQRLALCGLAFEEYLEKGLVEISAIERTLSKPSYTIQTLQALKTKENAQRMALVVGQDQIEAMHGWFKASDMLHNLDLVVAPRSSYESKELRKDSCIQAISKLADLCNLGNFNIHEKNIDFDHRGLRVWLLDQANCHANSTIIRENYQKGEPTENGWINKKVEKIIEAKGYYK